MKITLDIPNRTIGACLSGVKVGEKGLEMFAFVFDSDDLVDGNFLICDNDREES